ncbi:MFS transporter [Nocardiopsis sp. ATB16-24]|uniref:MFS transporter n=1 Tax=Nocardiopsis sp. ATB16-24 TaxID=3019555 RepID=UPI00255543CE|nr:MFS transporter [Nocardiopsis sp. ATB16-24]
MKREKTLVGKAFTSMFRSMRVRNYRLFATGQVVSVSGTWMMVVVQDWLVLDLSGNSAIALATVTSLQFTPILLLTLLGGRLADRLDKRTLLTVSNAASTGLALILAILVLTGIVRLGHVYVFASCLGLVSAVEVPTRMSFVQEMVGPQLLPNASALSAAYFNTARVAGPALGGLLLASVGPGPVVLLNAASFLATVAVLRMMRSDELHRTALSPGRARIVDGLRYVASRPDLVLPLSLVAAIGLFGMNFELTLPLLAKTVFETSPAAFGLLTTAMAAGSLLGALVTTTRSGRPAQGVVVGSAVAFGATATLVGWAPTFTAAMGTLFLTGFTSLYFSQAANHRVQLGSDPTLRGRVMALHTVVFLGTTPLGALIIGGISDAYSVRAGLYTGGLVSLATAAVAAISTKLHHRRRHNQATHRFEHTEG